LSQHDFREAARLASEMGVELLCRCTGAIRDNRGFPGDLVAYVADTFPACRSGDGSRNAVYVLAGGSLLKP